MSGDDVSCVNYLFIKYNITNIIKKHLSASVSNQIIKVMLMT